MVEYIQRLVKSKDKAQIKAQSKNLIQSQHQIIRQQMIRWADLDTRKHKVNN